jgi:hypothetical protein
MPFLCKNDYYLDILPAITISPTSFPCIRLLDPAMIQAVEKTEIIKTQSRTKMNIAIIHNDTQCQFQAFRFEY